MTVKMLMIQGTTSNAGKSILAAGLCRWLANNEIRVAPFKPQNMSLNSAVTADGGEIGRAQYVQAMACRIVPTVHSNPVLLKPNSQIGSQVIVQGKAIGNMNAAQYHKYKPEVMKYVLESFNRLAEQFEWLIVEGAGSPAEINLREGDIANMGFAEAVGCPVLIVSDIERGGVFAHLYGTFSLMSESEKKLIVGFVINRFRGDASLLDSGISWLEKETGRPVLGVLPYIENLSLEAEDSLSSLAKASSAGGSHSSGAKGTALEIAILMPPRVSNGTDFDALVANPGVRVSFINQGQVVPSCDLLILPGSKNVSADLQYMREQGWDKGILRHLRYGGKVLGICGGFQMLGRVIDDPLSVESTRGSIAGLGIFDMETVLEAKKQLAAASGRLAMGGAVSGYEIHMGISRGPALQTPLIEFEDRVDGALSADGQVAGTYLHGLFDDAEGCRALLSWAGAVDPVGIDMNALFEENIERLTCEMKKYIDLDLLQRLLDKQPVAASS
jgi:adenosylcobyric acid synthase